MFSYFIESSVDADATFKYEFKVPRLPANEHLKYSEFRLPMNEDYQGRKHWYKLKFYVKKGNTDIRKEVHKLRGFRDNEFNVFDVTSILSPWINGYHGNVSIIVRGRFKSKNYRGASKPHTRSSKNIGLIVFYSENKNFLKRVYNSYTSVETHGREKRELKKGKRRNSRRNRNKAGGRKEKNRPKCRMQDLEIDFDLVGWGKWIIHPKSYNAQMCSGYCPSPIPSEYTPTNHAMLQSLMRLQRSRVIPMTCCVPTKLGPISMLYYEFDQIVVRHHQDMIVKECGCR